MISYVRLKNYRSLVDFYVDFTGKRGNVKKFILVYGENGVGKSNFASVFYTLYETLRTKSIKDILERLIEQSEEEKEEDSFQNFLRNNFKDIEAIIKSSKTIGSQQNMVLEFGIKIGGKKGSYYLETDDTKIVSERLEYVINKNKTTFYSFDDNNKFINNSIFKDTEYAKEIDALLNQYWGKHSFLSLLSAEIENKKDGYVKKKICKGLYDVIAYFMTLSIRVKDGYRVEKGKMGISHKLLGSLEKGSININAEEELDKAECFLNEFFTRLYSDVKQVYYKRDIVSDKLAYHLIFRKQIYGKVIDVDLKKESTGTQYLLEMIPFFMASVEGQTVVIDEMDTGIHDLLVDTLLESLYDAVRGQIIITTHNTMLLESGLPKDCMYIFNVDENADKELLPISEFEERIHPNLNIRKRYLKGMYGGIPMMMDIDFDELLDIME